MSIIFILLMCIIGGFLWEIVHYIWFIISSRTRELDYGTVGAMYLSWKELRDFYSVNPDRWAYGTTGCLQEINHLYYRKKDGYIVVTLSFPSYMRLLWNYHFRHKKDTRIKEGFLDEVQKDIDALRRKAQAEIDQANRAMEQINSRMKEEKK